MYNRGKEIQAILRSAEIGTVYHKSDPVYAKNSEVHINTNPNPHVYIPIAFLSEHFQKDFEHDYWYFSLFYPVSWDYATNFFYWERSSKVSHSQTGNVLTISHQSGADCYDYYNLCEVQDVFNYAVGEDVIPGDFKFDTGSFQATVCYADGSEKWVSPSCAGIETNIPMIL